MLSRIEIDEIVTDEQGDYGWDDVANLKTQALAYVSLVEKIKGMEHEFGDSIGELISFMDES